MTFLAKQPHLKWLYELQIAGAHIGDLLHARTGIEHRGQERIVAAALVRRPVVDKREKAGLFRDLGVT
jgi:hypothetical protein